MNLEEVKKQYENINVKNFDTRIIKTKDTYSGEYHYRIHEVYYDENGKIMACTEYPLRLIFDNKEDLKDILIEIFAAIDRPILELKDNEFIETDENWKDFLEEN